MRTVLIATSLFTGAILFCVLFWTRQPQARRRVAIAAFVVLNVIVLAVAVDLNMLPVAFVVFYMYLSMWLNRPASTIRPGLLAARDVPVQSRTAEVEVSAQSDRLPRSAWFSAVPLAILLGTALYLQQNWDRIPERFPAPWGASGHRNHWATRSFHDVYGPLIFVAESWFGSPPMLSWPGTACGVRSRKTSRFAARFQSRASAP